MPLRITNLAARIERERFVSSMRLCCLGGVCDEHKNSTGPWIPGPEDGKKAALWLEEIKAEQEAALSPQEHV